MAETVSLRGLSPCGFAQDRLCEGGVFRRMDTPSDPDCIGATSLKGGVWRRSRKNVNPVTNGGTGFTFHESRKVTLLFKVCLTQA